jgi:uncharacterized damage-inducible protein DinB
MKQLLFLIALALPIAAQSPVIDDAKSMWGMGSGYVAASAKKIPAELYSFKPSPDVRTVGELVGHIANANYAICAGASGKASPNKANLEKLTDKDALVKALEESAAFCNEAAGAVTAANMTEVVKVFGMNKTRVGWLFFNAGHNWEHYGNLVTYMRINKIIPPSSEPKK